MRLDGTVVSFPGARALGSAALAASLALAASPAAAIDDFFPTFGNDGYDVSHYDLNIEVDPNSKAINAKARLHIETTSRLDRFNLDLAGLTVDRVFVGGKQVQFRQANDKLRIFLPAAVGKGTRFETLVYYHGNPVPLPDPTAPDEDPPYPLGWISYGKKYSYVVSEPVGASSFYPCNDEPTDKASFTFKITVPANFTAVANGLLTATTAIDGRKKVFTWEQREPMTTWLATVQISNNYRLTQQMVDGIPYRYYTTPQTSVEQIRELKKTPDIMAYFVSVLGKYPFDAYGSVVVDDPELYYALETQAMSTFPSNFIDEGVIGHELAHQWFGNAVSVAQWRDLWIAEGAATYFEFLYPNRNDPDEFGVTMRSIYLYLLQNEVGPAVVSRPEDLFADNTYYRGSVTLYALQRKVGQPTLFKILRTFYQTYNGGNATSEDFINTAVAVSGDASVREMLEAWLYEEPVPPLPDEERARSASAAAKGAAIVAAHKAKHRHATSSVKD